MLKFLGIHAVKSNKGERQREESSRFFCMIRLFRIILQIVARIYKPKVNGFDKIIFFNYQ